MKKKSKAQATNELLDGIDFVEFKKQRGVLQTIISSKILPLKEQRALEGLQNLCEDIAFHGCDHLGQPKTTLFLTPEFGNNIEKERKWHERNGKKFDKDIDTFVGKVMKKLK